jgi:hypothetical protein
LDEKSLKGESFGWRGIRRLERTEKLGKPSGLEDLEGRAS